MGLFGKFVYSNGQWGDAPNGEAYLSIDIHDSDIATVEYQPAETGAGRCYLGFQPRDYFEDPAASEPVALDAEATGLATWAEHVLGVDTSADEIRPLLAEAGEEDPEDDFVEETVERLLTLLGLPVPEELNEDADD